MSSLILFLDFDGVLSTGNTGTLRDAPALAAVLDEARPKTRIVLSTNWREREDVDSLRAWLPAGLATRVIGVTPELPEGRHSGGRQREIEAWLERHPTEEWLALDDSADLYAPGCPWLFLTDSRRALDAQTLARLRERLMYRRTGATPQDELMALFRAP